MLNDSISNLGNSFVINRQMKQQEEDRTADRDMRERMLQEQIAGRKDAAAARNQPLFRWKSRGAEITAHSLAEFGQLSQQHPADPEDDGFPITISGTDDTGTTKQLRFTIPKDLAKTPENREKILEQIKAFSDLVGAKPHPTGAGAAATAAAAPGSAIYDKATGKVLSTIPSAAAQREGEYVTTIEKFDAVPGTAGTPGTPGEKRALFGLDFLARDKPAVAAVPGTPGTPERTVTTRRKLGETLNETAGAGATGTPERFQRPMRTAGATAPAAMGAQPSMPAGPAGGAPAVGTPGPAATPPMNPQEAIEEANKAIARGADPEKVKARLRQMGITVK